ncbi:MAG: hypothetical protein ABIL58_29405 [Pseudomonadota bacterium]
MSETFQEQPPPFKIHNRTGSVNVTFTPTHFDGETFTSQKGEVRILKKGYLMIEMANASGPGENRSKTVYDWAGKVAMKLSDPDIHQILAGLRGEPCQIVHDPNKARAEGGDEGTLPKSCLQVSKGERFGWFMTMSRGERKAKCPLNDSDAATLRLLLERAVIRIFGW